jgi:molybdopterin-guanine dinucleotide biosynthesis protein A
MTGAVLAGGMSRRMGTNKAFIEVDGVPIIKRVLGVLEKVSDELLVIADDVKLSGGLGAIALPDAVTGAGSLGGIYTTLLHASSDEVFVAACDMPDISEDAVRKIITAPRGGALVVLPMVGGRPHPLHALYTRDCLAIMEEMIRGGRLRIGEFLGKVKVLALSERDFEGIDISASVANINTRDELLSLRAAKLQGKNNEK